MRSPRTIHRGWSALALLVGSSAFAQGPGPATAGPVVVEAVAEPGVEARDAAPDIVQAGTPPALPPGTRSGREIFERFREGLADRACPADSSSPRWRRHYSAAPGRLARQDETLALFGYVVDALREAHLPTEYALIPFVESGYKPGVRSPGGPAGLWQFIALTARNHKVPVRAGYDGRLSPVASTRAAVRYLKTLHGMFAGDWRLASMAFNAGEYRILGALRRSGQVARSADPEALPGLSGITRAYPRKIHALSCLLQQQADEHPAWLASLDRGVPRLAAVNLPDNIRDLSSFASRTGLDATQLLRLNPAFAHGRVIRRKGEPLRVIAPALADWPGTTPPESIATAPGEGQETAPSNSPGAKAGDRQHVVVRGDSPWTIARRYGMRLADLLSRNGLSRNAVLQPGMVLRVDAISSGDASATP